MAIRARYVQYYRTEVEDRAGQAYELLSHFASHDVNLLAIDTVPVGPTHAQFTLYPAKTDKLIQAAEHLGLVLLGPNTAILIQGDDHLSALLDVHRKLADAGINVYAAQGVSSGEGRYGYVIHVRHDDVARTADILNAE